MNGLKSLTKLLPQNRLAGFRPDYHFGRLSLIRMPVAHFSNVNPSPNPQIANTFEPPLPDIPTGAEQPAPPAKVLHPVVARRRQLVKRKVIERKIDLPDPKEYALLSRVKHEKETDYLEKFVHMLKHVKHSLLDIKRDFLYCLDLYKKKGDSSNYNIQEYVRYSKNKVDLFKFIPYSFFVIVPFAELVLPFYIWLFPRSTPEQFLMKTNIGQMHADKENSQDAAQKYLWSQLKAVMSDDIKLLEEKIATYQNNPLDTKALEAIRELDKQIVDKFLANYDSEYKKHLQITSIGPKGYEMLLDFYFRDYVSGIYIAHRLLNADIDLFNLVNKYILRGKYPPTPFRQFKWDNPDIVWARNILLKYQLISCFKSVTKEDLIASKHVDQLKTLTSEDLYQMTRQRALNIKSDDDRARYIESVWLPQLTTIDWDKRTWINVLRYNYCDILV